MRELVPAPKYVASQAKHHGRLERESKIGDQRSDSETLSSAEPLLFRVTRARAERCTVISVGENAPL